MVAHCIAGNFAGFVDGQDHENLNRTIVTLSSGRGTHVHVACLYILFIACFNHYNLFIN